MAAPNPAKVATNPRVAKLIELETEGRIKPEHQQELDVYRAQGLAPGSPKLTGEEGKATGFYNRAQGADADYMAASGVVDPTTKKPQDIGPVGIMGDTARAILPTSLVNSFESEGRQKSEQAKRDFILASLRYESGAAIGKDEFDKQDAVFFPQAGDGPALIAQKAASRQRVIESLKASSGSGAAKVDGSPTSAAAVVVPPAQEGDIGFSGRTVDDAGPEGSAEFQKSLQSAISSGQLKTPEDIIAFGRASTGNRGRGFDIDPAQAAAAIKAGGAVVATPRFEATATPSTAARAVAGGVADTGLLGFADEIGGAIDTARDVVADKPTSLYDNIDQRRANAQADQQAHPWLRLAGQVYGGAILPTRGATTLPELAGVGAAYGAGYGFGSGDGGLGSRFIGGVTGAATGAGLGYGLGRLGQLATARVAGRPVPPPTNGDLVRGAAQRQGVDIVAPDVAPGARSTYGFLESMPIAGGRVRADLQRGNDQIEARVAEIGGNAVADRADVGTTIQNAGRRYIDRSRGVVNRLYTRAEHLAQGQQITPTRALQSIDTQLADLNRTPGANAAKIDVLTRLRGDMVDAAGNAQPLDIDSVRALRTSMREELNAAGLRASDAERRVNMVLDQAGQDIQGQLTGPALRAYQRADRAHARRLDMVDNVVKQFIGRRDAPISGEATVGRLEKLAAPATGDAQRLDRMMTTLEPAERAQVAGTIASQLGRRGTEGDNAFSPALFFSQVGRYSPAARQSIWGPQGAADLADLARIAEQRGQVMNRMNNSRSGQVSNWLATLRGVLGGGGVGAGLGMATGIGASGGAGAAVGSLGASYVTARVLGSRLAIGALAGAARARTPAAQAAAVRRLASVAVREPEIANDLLPIQQALAQSPSRAAAADEKREGR